jgi:integrase
MTRPKSDTSVREIALDDATVAILTRHRAQQERARADAAAGWKDTGLVFTRADGSALHPAEVTARFRNLVAEAGLPPIRLHDLRHGAATLALAAGVDMKIVQEMLGHVTLAFTGDVYTSVLPDLAFAAAEAAARIVPRALPAADIPAARNTSTGTALEAEGNGETRS